jgi:hypothetical protein
MPTYDLPYEGFVRREEPLLPLQYTRETKFDIRARLKSVIEGFTDPRL